VSKILNQELIVTRAIDLFSNLNGGSPFCRCVEQMKKTSRGDLTPEELKERQV